MATKSPSPAAAPAPSSHGGLSSTRDTPGAVSPTFVIEKGIPVAKARGRKKYPFGDMEVGDSFLADMSQRQRLANAACFYGKRNNCRFTVRAVEGGIRVWRVA